VIDTSNFFVGQEVKKYEEMCRLFGEEEKKGSPRERQIENWKRFLSWDKKGHKFIITEVYDSPKPKIDRRQEGGNSVYSPILKKLIMHALFQCNQEEEIEDNALVFTNGQFRSLIFGWSTLEEYLIQRESDVIWDQQSDKFNRTDFESRFESKISEVTEDCLKSLVQNDLLDSHEKVYIIKEGNKERHSSEEETKKIDSLKLKVMAGMQIRNERYTSKEKRKELYQKINAELKSSEKWEIPCKTNVIKISDETLQKIEEFKLSSCEEESLMKDLMLKLCDFLDQNAFNRLKKEQEKINKWEVKTKPSKDAEYQKAKLNKPDKKSRFYFDPARFLTFETLPKDYVNKQKALSCIIRESLKNCST
jgi:hypothetical protein